MNSLADNIARWTGYDWPSKGEDWSKAWGNSYAQWNFCLRPRLAKHLPAGNVLEIATGYGRWTNYLVRECTGQFIGVDVVAKCTDYCRTEYGDPRREFITNDGLTLAGVPDGSIDLIFSMDSLVHADWTTLKSYLSESMRVLKPGGRAFMHHSNAAAVIDFKNKGDQRHYRAADVSAQMVREELSRLGGGVLTQEIIDWGKSVDLIDCLTTFGHGPSKPVVVENPMFMQTSWNVGTLAPLYT